MMRTTLNIDDDMKDDMRRRKIERLIQLRGKVRFSFDAKALRKGWERNFRGSR